MSMVMMGGAMKMIAMMPLAIAGLFILAGKALITAKVNNTIKTSLANCENTTN